MILRIGLRRNSICCDCDGKSFTLATLIVGLLVASSRSNEACSSGITAWERETHGCRRECLEEICETKPTADETSLRFASSIKNKIRASWLQGRTTRNKEYFDEAYIHASKQVEALLHSTENSRWSKLQRLSRAVLKRIEEIQNPTDCNTAKLVVYDISSHRCGFGCNLHDIMIRFILAVHANRTFVLLSDGWQYEKRGWEHFLLPLGKCKYDGEGAGLPLLSERTEHERVVAVVEEDFKVLDWSVPRAILAKLEPIHQDPFAWWAGQFAAYAFRLQPWFEAEIQDLEDRIGFSDKTIGIHVRWGDKAGDEAAKHEVDEYMDFVENWVRRDDGTGNKPTVYVATEDSKVWIDLKQRYPEYQFIGGGFVNETNDLEPDKKDSYEERKFAIESILTDLYLLSKCDYVVCTLSSNIGAVVYELMMTKKVDPSDRLQSLDLRYFLDDAPLYKVIQSHRYSENNDLEMMVGDTIIAHFDAVRLKINGYEHGMNERTQFEGRFPSYKVETIVNPIIFSHFEDL